MGMAASQARLLTLTSRLHDIEYKAQNIESQKIALATQKDELYQNYCDALDATKIQVAFLNGDGSKTFYDANFTTLCQYDENRAKQYSLIDAKSGKIIVDEKTASTYEDFEDSDKYSFAWAMLDMGENFGWIFNHDEGRPSMGREVGIGTALQDYGDGESNSGYNLFMTDAERMVFDKYYEEDDELANKYDILVETCNSDSATNTDKNKALEDFRDTLYKKYSTEIYDYMRLNKQDDNNTTPGTAKSEYDEEYPENFPTDKFNYYVNLYEEIEANGGCVAIDPQYEDGESGNEWFYNMVKSGRVLIDYYDGKQWTQTSVSTSTNENMLQEVQDDTDLKKAEAEYEHELDIINTKDTKYDQDLSKLETERTSITTEIESIGKVRDDNIERTFGIFS